MSTRLQLFAQLALITLMVVVAPLAPAPFSFWLGLAAVLLGPGMGIPRLLFPTGLLTLPEKTLIAGIASVFLTTATLAIVNMFGVLLSPLVISIAILAPTYLLVLAAGLRERFYVYQDVQASAAADRPAWLPFCCGVALAAVVTGGLLHMLGI
jgi:hypothetical protein